MQGQPAAAALAAANAELQQQLSAAQQQLLSKQQQLDEASHKLTAAAQAQARLEASIHQSAVDAAAATAAAQQQLDDQCRQQQAMQQQLAEATAELAAVQLRLDSLSGTNSSLHREAAAARQEVAVAEAATVKAGEHSKMLAAALEAAEQAAQHSGAAAEDAQRRAYSMLNELSDAQARASLAEAAAKQAAERSQGLAMALAAANAAMGATAAKERLRQQRTGMGSLAAADTNRADQVAAKVPAGSPQRQVTTLNASPRKQGGAAAASPAESSTPVDTQQAAPLQGAPAAALEAWRLRVSSTQQSLQYSAAQAQKAQVAAHIPTTLQPRPPFPPSPEPQQQQQQQQQHQQQQQQTAPGPLLGRSASVGRAKRRTQRRRFSLGVHLHARPRAPAASRKAAAVATTVASTAAPTVVLSASTTPITAANIADATTAATVAAAGVGALVADPAKPRAPGSDMQALNQQISELEAQLGMMPSAAASSASGVLYKAWPNMPEVITGYASTHTQHAASAPYSGQVASPATLITARSTTNDGSDVRDRATGESHTRAVHAQLPVTPDAPATGYATPEKPPAVANTASDCLPTCTPAQTEQSSHQQPQPMTSSPFAGMEMGAGASSHAGIAADVAPLLRAVKDQSFKCLQVQQQLEELQQRHLQCE